MNNQSQQFNPQEPGDQGMPGGPGGMPGGQMPQNVFPAGKPPKKKKSLLKHWWFWGLGVLVLIMVIAGIANMGNSGGGGTVDTASGDNTAQQQPAEQAPQEGSQDNGGDEAAAPEDNGGDEAADQGGDQGQEPADDYAKTIEKKILEGNGKKSFQEFGAESPAIYIADFETITEGTIRVIVQESLTDDGKEKTARWVFNMGCVVDDGMTPLDTVVVRDISGVDKNFFANRMNPPVLCGN